MLRRSLATQARSIFLLAVLASSACTFERRSLTSFEPTSILRLLLGSWSSALPASGSFGGFEWRITSVNGNSFSGEFSGVGSENIHLSGTVQGTVVDATNIRWSASGTATKPGFPPCPFSLTGTATLEGENLRVQYSGTTCFGPISGTEVLRRP